MAISRSRRGIPAFAFAAALLGGAGGALFGVCGPFTDVSDAAFCPFVLEIFTLGITTGTTPTTFDPASSVSRLQMAAFLSRTVDGVVKRGNRRAALGWFWNTQNESALAVTTVGLTPTNLRSDGVDVWVPVFSPGKVARVRGSDGKLLESWTGATEARGVVFAGGRVIVLGSTFPAGRLYTLDPTQAAGAVTTVASTLPTGAINIAFDGGRVWTANVAGSISIVTPGAIPWTVTTVPTGFFGSLEDILYDGANIWTADFTFSRVYRHDSSGAILQTVTLPGVDPRPTNLAFDGTNIWVTNQDADSVTVLRASSGAILQNLTGNGLKNPHGIAFDGERVLVANTDGDTASLWKAADLTPLGFFPLLAASMAEGVCSDGTHFWISLSSLDRIVRF